MDTDATNGAVADAAADTGSVNQDTAPVGSGTQNDGNPAWNELLGVLPSSLHQTVRPYLEKWDRGVQDRFTQVQSQYAPFKEFQGVDPEQIRASMQLAQLIATDPRSFYDRMTNHYGQEWGLADQGQGADDADDYDFDDEDDEGIDLENNPYIRQLQEQQDTIANFLASQVQREQAEAEARAVDEAGEQIQGEFAAVAQAHNLSELPVQAEKMIISLCMANEGLTIEQAAQEVMPLFAPKGPGPRIVSPGGGVPANNLDPTKMDSRQTKDMVATILAQAAQANRG